jgi:hypothetical protein
MAGHFGPGQDGLMPIPRKYLALAPLATALALAPAATAAPTGAAFTTPGEHAFTVPLSVTSVHVELVGARGGSGAGGGAGGAGASFGATLAVVPGQKLFAEVAGNGTNAVAGASDGLGGSGGGADGGRAVFLFAGAPGGGGGGGGTDVRTCSVSAAPASCPGGSSLATRLAVAGGGAGGGGLGSDASAKGAILGGPGGSGDGPGGPGGPDPHGDLGGEPGHQGGQASGGTPGGNSAGTPALGGELAKGGAGGSAPAGGGGGGGGGLYGGGGGGAGNTTVVDPNALTIATAGGAGGGGGSSGVPTKAPGVSSAATRQTAPGAPASVTLTWAAPKPEVSTGPPSSVTGTAAMLDGTVNPIGSSVSDCHFEITPAPAGGANVPCAQQIGAGSDPVAVTANVTGLAGATAYSYKLVAVSAAGSSTGVPVGFTTAGASGGGTPPDGTPPDGTPAGPGASELTLSALTLEPARFRVGRRGTTIAFTLSGRARVTVSFERRTHGRFVKVHGAVRITRAAGRRRVHFRGAVAKRKLSPGRYRVSVVASATGQVSKVHHARATVLR